MDIVPFEERPLLDEATMEMDEFGDDQATGGGDFDQLQDVSMLEHSTTEIPEWARDTIPEGLTEEITATKEEVSQRIENFKENYEIRKDISSLEFTGSKSGRLWVRWGKHWIQLTQKSDPTRFYAKNSLQKHVGVDFFKAIGLIPEIPPKVVAAASVIFFYNTATTYGHRFSCAVHYYLTFKGHLMTTRL